MARAVDKVYLFETMPVRRAVLNQIVPCIVSQMVVLLYNLADTYFVGLLNDPVETAAVTVSYPSYLMLTALSNLFAVGGASVLAHALGQKDMEKAKSTASIAFWWGLFATVLFAVFYFFTEKIILNLCGATPETYAATYSYAKWVVIWGGIGTVGNAILASLIRSEGNAMVASFGVSLGGVMNILLDPIFILPAFLGLRAEGAGMATALSNFISMGFFLIYILVKQKDLTVTIGLKYLKATRKYIAEIMKIGMPSAVQYLLTMVNVASLSKFVSHYETAAVAGLGIVKKLDLLPAYFSIGLSNGLLPLLAYNYSSGDQKRRHNAFLFASAISLGFSLLCVVVYELFAPILTGLFIKDALTISYSAAFLRIMVLAMPMMSLCYPMIVQFQAMGKARESLICTVLRKGVLDIPLLFVMDKLLPLYGCMMVQPMVDTVSLVACVYFYRRVQRELPLHVEIRK